jgi:hypothetical protein
VCYVWRDKVFIFNVYIKRIHVPPMDVPDVFPNGEEIPDLSKQDVADFCAEGQGKSVVGGGFAFGCLPIGNGMIAWNLVTSQDVPGIVDS